MTPKINRLTEGPNFHQIPNPIPNPNRLLLLTFFCLIDSPLSLPAEEEEAGDEDEDATDILEAERRFIAKAHFKCSEWVRSTGKDGFYFFLF